MSVCEPRGSRLQLDSWEISARAKPKVKVKTRGRFQHADLSSIRFQHNKSRIINPAWFHVSDCLWCMSASDLMSRPVSPPCLHEIYTPLFKWILDLQLSWSTVHDIRFHFPWIDFKPYPLPARHFKMRNATCCFGRCIVNGSTFYYSKDIYF